MTPGNVAIPPPPPLSDFQRRALTLFIKKKRSYYEKKDAIISRKYKWLEDLNQRDPDLEGIEISESSLEELKKKRESLCEEKHRLFEQLKNLLPATEEEEQPPVQFGVQQPGYPPPQQGAYMHPQPGYQPSYQINSGYPGPQGTGPNYHPVSYTPSFSSTPYSVITEPVTPKKPSEMSPVHPMKPSDMSPVSSHERTGYNSSWDNISPVNKAGESDSLTKFPSTEFSTPSAATKYAETRENRIDSFTKAFTDTISRAMQSELNMSLESATKTDSAPESSPLKPSDSSVPTQKPDSLLSPRARPKDTVDVKKPELSSRPRSPESARKVEPKPLEGSKRTETKAADPRRMSEHSTKSRKSISGTESNSSVSSQKHLPQSPQLKQRNKKEEEISDLPPVIKISKAEIHSKVMSWPTSHPFARKAGERTGDTVEKKPAGKKESADSSGSSLLEFAFQSALFGNTLFGDKEASPTPTPPQGPKTPPSTTASGPSDLLTALSMSYGSGPPRKQEKPSEEKRDQEKSRKRERSPEVRSPSPELVTVYKTETEKTEEKKEKDEEKGKEGEKKTTPPPPPPPPPPPKSATSTSGSSKKVIPSPATPTMSYTPCSPSHSPSLTPSSLPYSSFHPPLSFLSPTHPGAQYPTSQFSSPILPHKSPSIRSPMCTPYPAYPPHSPGLGMLPPPAVPPPIGALPPPHMPPLPPPHLLHPPHKNRGFPSNRYL